MKYLLLFICSFLLVTSAYGAEETTRTAPSAFIASPIYEFEPVVDGTQITHDYVIRNKGNTPLRIEDVKTP